MITAVAHRYERFYFADAERRARGAVMQIVSMHRKVSVDFSG
jgi:hypothetical protein